MNFSPDLQNDAQEASFLSNLYSINASLHVKKSLKDDDAVKKMQDGVNIIRRETKRRQMAHTDSLNTDL